MQYVVDLMEKQSNCACSRTGERNCCVHFRKWNGTQANCSQHCCLVKYRVFIWATGTALATFGKRRPSQTNVEINWTNVWSFARQLDQSMSLFLPTVSDCNGSWHLMLMPYSSGQFVGCSSATCTHFKTLNLGSCRCRVIFLCFPLLPPDFVCSTHDGAEWELVTHNWRGVGNQGNPRENPGK